MGAKQVLEHVWLVASGSDPVAFTDPIDCHSFLFWDGNAGVLIDAGAGRAADRWLDNVGEVCDPAALLGLIVTHYHADHAGGAASANEVGIDVLAHPITVRALDAADENVTQVARAREAGVYPPNYRLQRATARAISPNDTLQIGEHVLTVVDAPGHCDGHIVLRTAVAGRDIMFSGDCIFDGGRVSIQAIPDCRLDRYADTVIRLAELNTDVLLPGHGPLVMADAQLGIAAAAARFRTLAPPPNILDTMSK